MLRAFTIMELLVVSILTVITVGAALTAFELINKQYSDYEKDASRQMDLKQLQSSLYEDIYASDEILLHGNRLRCELPNYALEYYIVEEQLIRAVQLEGVRVDTSPILIKAWRGWLNGESMIYGKIDLLQIDISVAEKPFTLILKKEYSIADQLRFAD